MKECHSIWIKVKCTTYEDYWIGFDERGGEGQLHKHDNERIQPESTKNLSLPGSSIQTNNTKWYVCVWLEGG